ncbi:MAG: hypothetical protein E7184_01725 [Erysipelotrichaceae bacterium]|nr:hypothetical protein [Erysipelotrichaceae bacterium]
MSKIKEINELINKLSIQNSQIHYSYTKEGKFFVKTEKIFTEKEKLPSYLEKLSLSSGKIDKKKYKAFISQCETYRTSVLDAISNIKNELTDRQSKNISCINSVGLVVSKDIPDFINFTNSQQNLTYNFVVGTYIQGFDHYLEHTKGKKVYFKLVKDNLKSFLNDIKTIKTDKNVLSSNLPILDTIENDLTELLEDFHDYENTTKSIIANYDNKVKELLLTNTGSIKKVTA